MRYRVPRRLGWVEPPGGVNDQLVVYLMQLPDGLPLALSGPAALIWLTAIETSDVATAVAEAMGQARAAVAADVEPFVRNLIAQGLLESDAEE